MRRRLLTYLGLYAVLVLAAVPLILRWVPPNRWYGFRLPGARLDPQLWYEVNAVGGKLFAGAMVICLAVNLLLLWKGPQGVRHYLGWINAGLILLSFWLVTLQLMDYLP